MRRVFSSLTKKRGLFASNQFIYLQNSCPFDVQCWISPDPNQAEVMEGGGRVTASAVSHAACLANTMASFRLTCHFPLQQGGAGIGGYFGKQFLPKNPLQQRLFLRANSKNQARFQTTKVFITVLDTQDVSVGDIDVQMLGGDKIVLT